MTDTTNASHPTTEVCPLCCECYTNTPNPSTSPACSNPHVRITCSAPSGCMKFHMCRLCVYRQAATLSNPFVVDDETGDFCSIDPTACPQCKRPGAFVDSQLMPLSEVDRRREDDEARMRREGIKRRNIERMLGRLKNEARTIPFRVMTGSGLVNESAGHPVIRQLSGFPNHVLAIHTGCDTLEFAEYSTVGVPDLFTISGVLYYEVVVTRHAAPGYPPDFKCGFSLLNGLEISGSHTGVGVGETTRSWAFDSLGTKCHEVVFADQRFVPNWYPGCVMGFAVNLDKGMIACSKNGKWDIIERCGVKFEDESIKTGVYPCLSGRGVSMQFRYRPGTLKHSPPPMDLWDRWPKYQDLSWITIPQEARTAAMVMGYTSTTWAWSGNPIDSKDWDDMSPEEQEAGNVLGYDKKIWSQLTSLWRQDEQDNPDSDSDDNMSYSCFSVMFWNDLPEDARQAAETLGYSKTAWDEDSRVPLSDKWFSQLTQEQRRAAIILGYDCQTWNEHTESNLTSSKASVDSWVLPFDHLKWNDLPRNAREAAEILGYTKDVWDGNDAGPLDDEPWGELTREEQNAATILGYDGTAWNESL